MPGSVRLHVGPVEASGPVAYRDHLQLERPSERQHLASGDPQHRRGLVGREQVDHAGTSSSLWRSTIATACDCDVALSRLIALSR